MTRPALSYEDQQLRQANIATSEQLIKALKASQPSPAVSGISKIQLARAAWSTSSFFVPKKHQLIAEWVLESLCRSAKHHLPTQTSAKGKDKAKPRPSTGVAASDGACELEADYWALLNEIVQSQVTAPGTTRSVASQWVNSLVSAYPIVTLASSLAKSLAQQPQHSSNQALTLSASQVLKVLLPSASSRSAAANIETVSEAIQAWLDAIPLLDRSTGWQAAAVVLKGMVDSWAVALEFGLNSRKNAHFFLSHSLSSYFLALSLVRRFETSADTSLSGLLEQVGAASLFTNEVLLAFVGEHADRAMHPAQKESNAKVDEELLKRIGALAASSEGEGVEATLLSLPVLLRLLTLRLRKEAPSLLTPTASTSYSALSAAASIQAQEATLRSVLLTRFLRPISALMQKSSVRPVHHEALACARKDFLTTIESLDLYVPGGPEDDSWASFFRLVLDDSVDDLQHCNSGDARAEKAFESLQVLWSLERTTVETRMTTVLRKAATVPVTTTAWDAKEEFSGEAAAALSYLRAALSSYARARDVPGFVSHLYQALTLLPDDTSASMQEVQNGLLLSAAATVEVASTIRDFLIPMQLVPLLDELRRNTFRLVDEVIRAENRAPSPRPGKRRKSESGNLDEAIQEAAETDRDTAKQRLYLALQVLALVLANVQIPSPIRSEAIASAEQLYSEVVLPALDLGLGQETSGVSESPSLLPAALRARSSLLSTRWRVNFDDPIRLDGSPEVEALEVLDSSLDQRREQLGSLASRTSSARQDAHGETTIEVIKTVLQRAERDSIGHGKQSEFTSLLSEEDSLILQWIVPLISRALVSSAPRLWDGKMTNIKDDFALASAVWHIFVFRWAELLDQLASQRLLLELTQILLASLAVDPTTSAVAAISLKAVRNAHFLELPRWRSTLLSMANAKTQILSGKEFHDRRPTLATLDQVEPVEPCQELQEALLTLCAMGRFPIEWISKSSRDTLLDRSLTLDAMLATGSYTAVTARQWTSLRLLIGGLVLTRGSGPGSTSEKMTASLALLVADRSADEEEAKRETDEVSLAAFQVGVRNLAEGCRTTSTGWDNLLALHRHLSARLASSERTEVDLVAMAQQALLSAFVGDAKLVANAEYVQAWTAASVEQNLQDTAKAHFDAIHRLIERAASIPSKGQLEECIYHLKQVRFELVLTEARASEPATEPAKHEVRSRIKEDALRILRPICRLVERMTAAAQAGIDNVAQRALLKALLQMCAETLLLLAEALSSSPPPAIAVEPVGPDVDEAKATADQGTQAEDAAAALKAALAFASFASCFGREELVNALSPVLVRIVGKMTVASYDGYLLALLKMVTTDTVDVRGNDPDSGSLYDRLSITDKDSTALIVTFGISLQNGPEGSRRSARTQLTKLLSYFTQLDRASPPLVYAMVEVVEAVCSRKAILLRSTDVGLILQLFTVLLTPSNADTPWPATLAASNSLGQKIFTAQVSSLTSLIRLRPDLVHAYLSHLGAIISSLSTLFRRPKLVGYGSTAVGPTQAKYLHRDFPLWFDPAHSSPLRAEVEARHFSRLLTSVTLKTSSIVSAASTHGRKAPSQRKAESLAKPFSKHAIYVLVSYLRAVTSPASTVPSDVRMELDAGLLALCGVVGKHERDAAMVGLLDSAGRTLLKALWKRWEAERYRGQ